MSGQTVVTDRHAEYFVGAACSLRRSAASGRHLVAHGNLPPGAAVLTSEAYLTALLPSHRQGSDHRACISRAGGSHMQRLWRMGHNGVEFAGSAVIDIVCLCTRSSVYKEQYTPCLI